MDVFYAYTYGTAAWFTVQGLPLVSTPKMIVTLLLDETRLPTDTTVIEIYFARSFGLALLTLAVLTVLLTGSIPLTATVSEPVTTDESDPRAPYAVPTLAVTSVLHALCSFHAYTRYAAGGQAAFALGMAGSMAGASVGLWCLLFGSSRGRISPRTGADKRTAGFPFKNRVAEKRFAGLQQGEGERGI